MIYNSQTQVLDGILDCIKQLSTLSVNEINEIYGKGYSDNLIYSMDKIIGHAHSIKSLVNEVKVIHEDIIFSEAFDI